MDKLGHQVQGVSQDHAERLEHQDQLDKLDQEVKLVFQDLTASQVQVDPLDHRVTVVSQVKELNPVKGVNQELPEHQDPKVQEEKEDLQDLQDNQDQLDQQVHLDNVEKVDLTELQDGMVLQVNSLFRNFSPGRSRKS